MARIYIAHAPQDLFYAQELGKELESYGHQILRLSGDRPDDYAFASWWADAFEGVDAIIFLLSRHLQDERQVQHEMESLTRMAMEMDMAVLPLLIDDSDARSWPNEVRRFLILDVADRTRQELLSQIDTVLTRHQTRKSVRQQERHAIQERVENTAADYVSESLDGLKAREKHYAGVSYFCYGAGISALALGLLIALLRLYSDPPTNLSWPEFAQFALLIAVVVGFLAAIAKYAFVLGKSFMVESLRNADRIHAIKFGEFYLNAFGEQASWWGEMRDAFRHWNLDSGSAFIDQKPTSIDPQVLSAAHELVKKVRNS